MKFSIYKDRRGFYRWRLRAGNNHIVADSSEGYTRKLGVMRSLRRIRKEFAANNIEIIDTTRSL